MTPQERYQKATEILDKFDNGKELNLQSPMFHQAVQMLVEGIDPYKVIEQIVVSHDRIQHALEDFILRSGKPQTFFIP